MNPLRIFKSAGGAVGGVLQRASAPLRRIWPHGPEAMLGLVSLLIVGLCLLTYSPALARWASTWFGGNQYVSLVDGMLNPFRNRHSLMQPGVPVYDLKVDKSALRAIEVNVAKAKKQGWLTDDLKLWVDGRLIHDGKRYDVKVRVRGDLPNHWSGDKKSWAIRFTRKKYEHEGKQFNEPIYLEREGSLAKRQISLILPGDRDYAVAPFVNRVMREQGVITPQDRMAILRINGIVQGLYYEVEDLDNTVLASHHRPESTVFGQNGRPMHFEQYTKLGTPAASDTRFDMASLRRDVNVQSDLGLRAMQVLFDFCNRPTPEGFQRARAVLDWEKYLKFRSLTTLLNTNHVRFGSDNFKLFFDESQGLFEPIPWDCHLTKMPGEPGTIDYWNSHGPDELQRATLNDPRLRLERNKVLWSMVSDGGQKLLKTYQALHDELRPLAWNDLLVTPIQGHKMDQLSHTLRHNVERVHKVLSTSCGSLVLRLESADRAIVELACTNFGGVHFAEMTLADKKLLAGEYQVVEDANDNGQQDADDPILARAVPVNGLVKLPLNLQVLPRVKYDGDTIDGRYWQYMDTQVGRRRLFLIGTLAPAKRDPLVWTAPKITVGATNAVTDAKIPFALAEDSTAKVNNSIAIATFDASDPLDLEAIDRTLPEFLAAYTEFQPCRSVPGAAELSGSVRIERLTIVPKSVPLVIQPGADITILPGVSLLCYGGLTAIGTADQPIRIHDAGSGEPFGTFACVRPTQRKVVMRHCDISGGSQAQVNCTLFTGGLAVHDGDLELVQSSVHDMASEDGINVKNGHIRLDRCLVARTRSDAVDLDFCTGELVDSRFENVNGDGVELTGSKVLVANSMFVELGAHAIGAGNQSQPTLVNNVYLNCAIGVSCKDRSHAQIAHCTFVGSKTAIEASRKNPSFGGASGELVNCVFRDNAALLSEDYFSHGKLSVRGSVADQPSRFATCLQAKVSFADSQAGDWRVRGESLPKGFAAEAVPDWAKGMASSAESSSRVPGIVSIPPLAPVKVAHK